MIAEQDNIRKELTDSGELIFEPGYAAYLRSMGYKIRDITDIDTVQSESNPDKKYLVAKIETFNKQQDHPDLDYVADKVTLHTCSCWDWRRNHSADLENFSGPVMVTLYSTVRSVIVSLVRCLRSL